MGKKRIIKIKTVPVAINSDPGDDQKTIRQLAFLLFTAAGKTGGTFKIEAKAQKAYEQASGDLHIVITEEEVRGNGDLFVTIIRERDKKPAAGTKEGGAK